MTRNTIGVPPLETRDTPGPGVPRPRSAVTPAERHHPGMKPEVEARSRVGDVPDVASHDLTERDTPVNLYIAIGIVVVIVIIAISLIAAF